MRKPILLSLCALGLVMSSAAAADELELVINGVDGEMLQNVTARTQSFRITGNTRLSKRKLDQLLADAQRRAGAALRPFGYYQPVVTGRLEAVGERSWKIHLDIDKGPPVLVSSHAIDVVGPGSDDPGLQGWLAGWPLTDGQVLNQQQWEQLKEEALRLASMHGYLSAGFNAHEIRLDLVRNRADLELILATGEQAVMGSVDFEQDIVDPAVLVNLPRFAEGEPYDEWLLEQFRLDLWRTGYFETVDVVEHRSLEASPPRVDLVVKVQERKRNTYQGSFGYGTDTSVRLQAMWSRHLLSRRGDNLDVGIGWQEQRNELQFRTNYRLPRKVKARQFWTAELAFRTELQKFELRPEDSDEEVTLAEGNVQDYSFKPGWLRIRSLERGFQQIFEHWYVQFLKETNSFNDGDVVTPFPRVVEILGRNDLSVHEGSETIALGVSWDWPVVRGSGFRTVGRSHRAHVFTSNKAFASDLNFTQAYLSSRWNTIWRDRWKFLLRGEIGYTNANVFDRTFEVDGQTVNVSITELPNAYRFKAGGSQSVRGYGFEDLSNNNIGSNNIVTASAELEYRFLDDWSAAVFMDVGNAFNDWSEMKLKKGVGLGIRWYSIAGPIRLDFARALDQPGESWRIHFTIGTPLL